MQVLSIGDQVVEGRYRIHSRFRRAVNYADDEGIVCLVAPEVGAGPINIVVDELRTAGARALTVGTRQVTGAARPRPVIWLGDRAIDCSAARVFDSSLDSLEPRRGLAARLEILRKTLAREAPPRSLAFVVHGSRRDQFRPGFEAAFADHASTCVTDILFGDTIRGVARLKGSGFGLTPSGDDFIRGLLVGMWATDIVHRTSMSRTRQCVYEAARTGGELSEMFLLLAAEGRVGAKVKTLVAALICGRFGQVRDAAMDLCMVGETSGADLATGLLLSLEAGPSLALFELDLDGTVDIVACGDGDVMMVS